MKMGIVVADIKAALGGDIKRLERAFVWSETPEGMEYWQIVSSKKKLPSDARAKLLAMLKLSAPLRGFASMDPERQRAIASAGGKAVRPENRSFSQNPDLARAAGRKGGLAVPAEKRTYSTNPELAAEAGRKGGVTSRRKPV